MFLSFVRAGPHVGKNIRISCHHNRNLSTKLFDKVLIANRGEIAIRIIKSCEKLGIKTVAVYSEADADSLFVKRANEAVCIGPPQSIKSYLSIDAIIDACKKTGAQGVHPGYGFLSENYRFAEALEKSNITFIGPSKDSLYLMGDKIESKRCAHKAGVNTVPGFDGTVKDADQAVEISRKIGYPVMIKAAGGGGGKGMRMAYNDQEARDGFRLSIAEAKSSFNDDRMLLEKFIEEPRHIEFQILGDKHGNIVHLNERECSVQRRNQKLLEEAPSPALTPEKREEIGNQAKSLAKAANYYSAGTVEFLIDKHGDFFFLEMNTRLQVEHPITEMITGVDIVENMIRIACGQELPFKQNDISINGWAIENRVNSENPYKNLGMPSIGRVNKYSEPIYLRNVRIDSGIEEGSVISMYYDSMIAKSICHGKDRQEALKISRDALDRFVIKGVNHNVSLLRDVMDEADFASGNFTTKYLQLKYPDGFKGRVLREDEPFNVVSASIYYHLRHIFKLASFDVSSSVERGVEFNKRLQNTQFVLSIDNATYKIKIVDVSNLDTIKVKINENDYHINILPNIHNYYTEALVNDQPVVFQKVSRQDNNYKVQLYGTIFDVTIFTEDEHDLFTKVPRVYHDESTDIITSPMQGSVVSIRVKPGDNVIAGNEVAVVEAMKMQNSVCAHRNGKVKSVNVVAGGKIGEGEVLVEYEPLKA